MKKSFNIGKQTDEESLLLPDGFCVAANGVRPLHLPGSAHTRVWEKYDKNPSPLERVRVRYWTPYQYAGCNPVSLFDLNGLAPGDPFSTPDEAATDFGKCFNGISIQENGEYNTAIYSFKIGDKIHHSYTEPVPGSGSGGNQQDAHEGTRKEADAHTHGGYDKSFVNQYGDGNNDFSRTDKYNAQYPKNWSFSNLKGMPVYGAFPNGTLWLWDPNGKRPVKRKLISKNLPFDTKDPSTKKKLHMIDNIEPEKPEEFNKKP